MVIVRVNKSENKLFNALSFGLRNSAAYNFVVDKNVVATLTVGQETQVNIQPGKHKVYFKDAAWGGNSSNKMTITFEPDQNMIIEMVSGAGNLAASYRTIAHNDDVIYSNNVGYTDSKTIKCAGCGANNIITDGRIRECEFCGTPLTF